MEPRPSTATKKHWIEKPQISELRPTSAIFDATFRALPTEASHSDPNQWQDYVQMHFVMRKSEPQENEWVPKRTTMIWSRRSSEVFLYAPHSSTFFQMNGTASLIWEACDGKTRMSTIVSQFIKGDSTERASLRNETSDFLALLKDLGLIDWVTG